MESPKLKEQYVYEVDLEFDNDDSYEQLSAEGPTLEALIDSAVIQTFNNDHKLVSEIRLTEYPEKYILSYAGHIAADICGCSDGDDGATPTTCEIHNELCEMEEDYKAEQRRIQRMKLGVG